MKKFLSLGLLFIFAVIISGCNVQTANQAVNQPTNQVEEEKMEKTLPSPTMGIDQTKSYEAILKTEKKQLPGLLYLKILLDMLFLLFEIHLFFLPKSLQN